MAPKSKPHKTTKSKNTKQASKKTRSEEKPTISRKVLECLIRAMQICKPKPQLNPAEWANTYLHIPQGETRYPGKFSTLRVPYQHEMLACVTEPEIQRVTYMLASQCSKTQTLTALALYYTHWVPSSVGLYFTNDAHLREFSKDRLQASIEVSPALKNLVKKNTTKDAGNTIYHKRASNGAILRIKNANVGSSFRGPSFRLTCMDEVDALKTDVDGEGDPLQQAMSRGTVWGDLAKFVVASTPTIKDASLTETSFLDSDQRYYYVPCPHCGHMQVLEMSTADEEGNKTYWFVIPDDPTQAHFLCKSCKGVIREESKQQMLAKGEWRKHNPEVTTHAGFTLSTFYSPFYSWTKLAREWKDATAKGSEALKAYVNTRLAQTWTDYDSSKLNSHTLEAKREDYGCLIPREVAYITIMVDIQHDRIEASVYGFGLNDQMWLIRHYVIYGATVTPHAPAFKSLTQLLKTEFDHESGKKIKPTCTFVDSSDGDRTQTVYEFCKPLIKQAVFAMKGASTFVKGGLTRSTAKKEAGLVSVDTNQYKDVIMPRLSERDKSRPGYIHFPSDRICYLMSEDYTLSDYWCEDGTSYDSRFLDQFLAEYKVNGRWKKKPTVKRNEALDCCVGAYAAFQLAKRERWAAINIRERLKALNGYVPGEEVVAPVPVPEPAKEAPIAQENKTETVKNVTQVESFDPNDMFAELMGH